MKISYNWLSGYIPEKTEPERMGNILTSVGLEVESLEMFEEVKGNLKDLLVGEVMECEKHPGADKLKLTKVSLGNGELLQIICGANNVAAGQKVVVAPVGSTLYPAKGHPINIKKAKIRGIDSEGMICAEDEIGIGANHEGIIVLDENAKPGTAASAYFKFHTDHIFELGITPNRMDAMSHLGVAKDVCAYLSHHNKKSFQVISPLKNSFKADQNKLAVEVVIENPEACKRYAGVSFGNVKIQSSPEWMQQQLKSIGVRPVNNIVDITNYILHETGQPLHAFDADKISGKKIIVKNLPGETTFKTLDEKERKLNSEDIMICDGEEKPMCFGGVFGGIDSGVTDITKNIFLESAWFDPSTIRRTSVRHNLRTDASTRFEKGVDISKTVLVLKRAAMMIKEITGAEITSDIIDVYPQPKEKTEIILKNHYLKKISGKNYHPDAIRNILQSLDFEILKEGQDDLRIAVPFSKPDISLPVDVIEEIMRIDGYDNVDIPATITISPAIETSAFEMLMKEKVAGYLSAAGFAEILTNPITNSNFYKEEELRSGVRLLNSLTAELDMMRLSMAESGLQSISHNLNHKNTNLLLFEFGRTYSTLNTGDYKEEEHLAVYASGNKNNTSWKEKGSAADIYFLKGIVQNIFRLAGMDPVFTTEDDSVIVYCNNEQIAKLAGVDQEKLLAFSVKQPVIWIDINWDKFIQQAKTVKTEIGNISRYPEVHRDISMIINKNTSWSEVEKITSGAEIQKLKEIKLFDIFESDKLGAGKKSFAISFTFADPEKTMTDKEIDAMMNSLISAYEKQLGAEIRKA